jgi:chromosome segregation ATPase
MSKNNLYYNDSLIYQNLILEQKNLLLNEKIKSLENIIINNSKYYDNILKRLMYYENQVNILNKSIEDTKDEYNQVLKEINIKLDNNISKNEEIKKNYILIKEELNEKFNKINNNIRTLI